MQLSVITTLYGSFLSYYSVKKMSTSRKLRLCPYYEALIARHTSTVVQVKTVQSFVLFDVESRPKPEFVYFVFQLKIQKGFLHSKGQ